VNRLFIELYLDEDVNILVATLVRSRHFVAVTAQEAGQLQKSDAEQLEYAVSQGKALLSHNRRHFEVLAQEYVATGRTHYGLILAARHSPYELLRRLLLILNHVTADEMQDQVRFI
jgi:hypothetical protein